MLDSPPFPPGRPIRRVDAYGILCEAFLGICLIYLGEAGTCSRDGTHALEILLNELVLSNEPDIET